MNTSSKKRWLRFILRTMLVTGTVLCVLLAWKVRKVERQKEAVAAIERTGGSVRYDWAVSDHPQTPGKTLLRDLLGDDFFDEVVEVDFTVGIVSPEEADAKRYQTVPMQLRDLTSLRKLNLGSRCIKDLKLLNRFAQLEWLCVTHNEIDDLSPLANNACMDTLLLDYTTVRDLSPLEGMSNLKRLSLLFATEVDDITPLGSLTTLEYLILTNTKTCDVSPLMKLKGLKQLVIFTPRVPGKQIEMLRRALPNCEIIYGEFTDA